MVPEFTIAIRPVSNKPELIIRKRFKNGIFEVGGLQRTQYQVDVASARYIGTKMEVSFLAAAPSTNHRVIVLHKMRNDLIVMSSESAYMEAQTSKADIPERALIAYERGLALHEDGKLEEALVAYGESLQAYPNHVDVLSDIAAIYLLLNRPDSALTYLSRAHSIDRSNAAVRLNIGVAQIAKRQYAEALKTLDRICRDVAEKTLPRLYIAQVYISQNYLDDANRILRQVVEDDPRTLDGWVMLINLALQRQQYGEAREALTRLRDLTSDGLLARFVEDQLSTISGN